MHCAANVAIDLLQAEELLGHIVMAQNGPQVGLQTSFDGLPTVAGSSHYAHIPHDSALSVGSSKAEEDAARIRDLEDEVRTLAERANTACMFTPSHG